MKAKRVLLGLLIAGLVVVGLSGVVWGDEWTSKTDVDGSSFPDPPPSGSVTVNIHIRTWALLYFGTDSVTLQTLDSSKVSASPDSTTGVEIADLGQDSPSEGSKLIAATNHQGTLFVKAEETLGDGLGGHISVYNGSSWVQLNGSNQQEIEQVTTPGCIKIDGVKFKYSPTVQDTTGSHSATVKFTLTTS